jgi:ComF family protein
VQLVFPDVCIACGEKLRIQENYLCLKCLHDLPRTRFHLVRNNKAEQMFWGKIPVEKAVSFFYYRKGSRFQKIIHHIKYKGLKEAGLELGRQFGFELAESKRFVSVDLLIPVPLHPQKRKKRGFNQSEWIARGLSLALNKPVSTGNVQRTLFTESQTMKTRYERWQNVAHIFKVQDPEPFMDKHILLVDDVLTTGATLEACALALVEIPGIKISIATLGFADY